MDLELIGVIVLSISLIGIILAYDRSLRELKRLKKDKHNQDLKSRQLAVKLVGEARLKAMEIMTNAQMDSESAQKLLDEKLDELIQGQLGEYKEELQKVSENITSEIKKDSEEFGKVLEMETLGVQKAIEEKLKQDYTAVEMEISEYKDKRIKQFETNLAGALEEAGRKVLNKSISVENNTSLIIEALEEAKKRHAL